jgi:predicted ATP-binding protein involved in virulence
MYIHRIILRDVKSIEHLDITLHDDWRDEPLKSILFTGPNGSGKTTILKVIAALWETFGNWLNYVPSGALTFEPDIRHVFLRTVGLAAIEIHDLAAVSVCIYASNNAEYSNELHSQLAPDTITLTRFDSTPRPSQRINEWFEDFARKRERLLRVGDNSITLPNLLFIDAETRFSKPLKDKQPSDFERFYEWFATNESLTESYGNLNKLLSNLKIRSPERFYDFVKQVNGFLGDKKHLTDFGADGELRLRIQLNGTDKFHYSEDLSSGEQQCILLMYLASRWLMPGGIMLIDEPDLHLHESLQRHFVRELQKVVVEAKQGQLIVTSHSPTVWQDYHTRQRFEIRPETQQEETNPVGSQAE